MADASCGPSNPLQQFRKAVQADRTLQQDRLVNRASPSQGFRSAPGHVAGNLDPEFEAFQAGMPAGPGLHDPNHLPLQSFQPGPMPQQQPQLPAWAADFQRLHIASPQPQAFVPQTRQAPSSWHLDFMKQQQATQATSIQQVQHQTPVHSMFGGVPRYGAFNQSHFEPSFAERPDMTVAEGKQRAQDGPQQFGDAAFDQAFEQLDQEVALTAEQHAQADETAAAEALREREAERIAAEIEQEHAEQVQQFEQIDAEELKQSRRNLFSMYEPGHDDPLADQHDILDQIEAEAQERFQQELQNIPEQTQDMRPQDPVLDADELSRTAAQLLDSVSHDQSDKFQQSNFLELMRRLRDKEVRVEGNEMVENATTAQIPQTVDEPLMHGGIMPQERIPQQEQDLDPGRQKNPLEDFNLDTFLSSAPETRHAWQEDFERSMAQGPGKEEGQAAATQGDATSYADDIDMAISESVRSQLQHPNMSLHPDSSSADTRRALYLPRDAEHALELIRNNTYSAPGMAELEVWWRVAAGEEPRAVWDEVVGAYEAMDATNSVLTLQS